MSNLRISCVQIGLHTGFKTTLCGSESQNGMCDRVCLDVLKNTAAGGIKLKKYVSTLRSMLIIYWSAAHIAKKYKKTSRVGDTTEVMASRYRCRSETGGGGGVRVG